MAGKVALQHVVTNINRKQKSRMTDIVDIDDLLTKFTAHELINQLVGDGRIRKLTIDQAFTLSAARDHQYAAAASERVKKFRPGGVIAAANNLVASIDACLSGDAKISEAETAMLEEIRDAASRIKWTYPVKYNFRKLSRKNRTQPLISGPLYTSEKYPWPMGKAGQPLEPICQLNLAETGSVAQIELGNGLLQLWMDGSDGVLREIPNDDVSLDLLAVVPEEITKFVWKHTMADRIYESMDPWTHGYVITGTGKRALTIPSTLINLDLFEPEFTCKSVDKAYFSLDRLKKNGMLSPSDSGHFSYFGNFDPIQYNESEKDDALFLMESGDIFTWGDCGNAQLFYRIIQDGKVEFSFDWSCH